jgi:pyrrolidone-carboxylate peptidase
MCLDTTDCVYLGNVCMYQCNLHYHNGNKRYQCGFMNVDFKQNCVYDRNENLF